MRRLMFITQTHTVWGGMESWVHELAERMLARGWQVYGGLAKGARFSNPEAYSSAHPHLQPVVMDATVGTESSRVRAIERALRRVRPDVTIPVAIGSAFDAMTTIRTATVVPVMSMHAGWIANVIANRDTIDVAVPISRILERLLERELGAEKVRYIRQGVPRASTPHSPRQRRLRAAIISRMEQSTKRVMDLARVADLATDGIEFHVYGDGPDLPALRSALGDRATFHGYTTTPELYRDAYPNLDVLLLFSPAEGGPNTIFEAMHNGVVPVSSRYLGSAAEGILRDGENSLLFDVADTEKAAEHLRSLVSEPAWLDRLSASARRTVDSYTDAEMFDAWVDVIETATPHDPRERKRGGPATGRLERLLPAPTADLVRRTLRLRYPHASGWEEWPGSQPVERETEQRIEQELRELDSANPEK
jgi:glycosyltransferase involved in cell wall biosynthesis